MFEAGLDPETVQAAIAAGTAAETARAAAVLAKTDAEAAAAEVADVVATNDGIMKAVAENPESAFSIELSRTMGAEAADPDSPLGTELRATFAPPVGMLVQMLGIIRARKRGYRLMVIGDSTSWYSTPSSWLRRLPTALAALFPWLTIELRIWDDATAPGSYTSVQTINGTTSQKLMIYGYVRSSMTFDYFADDARRSVAFPVAMDGVWVALGHNENNPGMASESGFGITALRAFSKAALHLELYRAYAGNAPMLVMSQNAITTNAGAPEQWAAIYQRICADRGYGFLDVAAAFNADPRGVAALLLGDGLHPNADGHQLWLAVVVGALAASSSAASQIIASATPTITLPGLSGIAWVPPSSTTPAGSGLNNLLQSRDNTTKLPAGWVGTNVTVTETTDIIGETGHRCLKLVKTDPAQPARIEQYLNYAALRGKTITAGFRIHVPSGQGNTVGVAELQGDDGTGTSISYTSPAWGQFDQWFWRTAMLRLPNGTNMIRRRIWLDQAGTDTDATLYLDRASLAIGGYPYEAA
ncbi:MAG: SGNH/GDSL hydrolase family protein [Microbacterium sp.]|uniref:SGNH/GDSL hydrolase family protein n=1 Tax=Microbacterium sp. TaxID=51671 RepID=UPI001AD5EC79|nr:SGNH/GDSL hydrolase family protein [Microbacterium sp.]MBN9176134.1 SGNH/GDSL hydrolase family protein [Microbacterium sp.]